jgi:micrococcal nuclease
VLVVVVLALAAGACRGGDGELHEQADAAGPRAEPGAGEHTDPRTEPVGPVETQVGEGSDSGSGDISGPATVPPPSSEVLPIPETTGTQTGAGSRGEAGEVAPGAGGRENGAVSEVVDGDTVDLGDGRRVRLIGIDTPEKGECGWAEATTLLEGLVEGRTVVLVTGARSDVDRYGRLLRYVEVDGVDANLAMIASGRAVARYDSRDGYGSHPREAAYVQADDASPSANICAATDPGDDPRFPSCREAKTNGFGPYRRGVDPEYAWYRDGDGDGVACE